MKLLGMIAVFAAILSGCGGSSDLSDAVDATAAETLGPAYQQASTALDDLDASVEVACATLDEAGVLRAQDAWQQAQVAWKRTSPMWFGPTTMDRLNKRIGYEPISEEGIEGVLDSGVHIDTTYILEASPVTHIGLGAAEYLIFGDVPLDERRCEYLTAVSSAAAIEGTELQRSWLDGWDGGSAYLDRFTGSAPPELTSNQAISEVVAAISERLKHLTLFELGPALGITTPAPEPDAFPEGAAYFGLGALRAQLGGLVDVYGSGSESVSGLVASRASETDALIRSDMTAAVLIIDELIASIDSISMAQALTNEPTMLEDLYERLASLRRTFETTVVSVLDVTLAFIQGDGDGG